MFPVAKSAIIVVKARGMEVLKVNDGVLCNAEVIDIIKDLRGIRKDRSGKISSQLRNRETIERKTETYLLSKMRTASSEQVMKCIAELSELSIKFDEDEKMAIVNHAPTSPVVLSVLLQGREGELDDDMMSAITEIVERNLRAEPL